MAYNGDTEERGKHMANLDDSGLFIMPDEYDDTTDLSAAKDAAMPDYIMPSKLYDILKWVGLILMPALAALIGAVGPAWGMPNVDAVVLTINALGTFIGVCIGASQVSAMGRVKRDWQ